MKKTFIGLRLKRSLAKLFCIKRIVLFLMCFLLVSVSTSTYSQNQPSKTVSGTITDATNAPLLGVSIVVKGTTIGTISDINGNFSLSVPGDAKTLVFSFVGMTTQEVAIGNLTRFTVTLAESAVGLGEVVVVGYGSQKKESVVGSIVQTTNKELRRAGAVANLAMALTGNLPGVTTIQYRGEPGDDDPRILIRAQGTWNNSQPLILIDGVERKMNDIDVAEVETISVLKDASATAVFGVKGAEGVILITTKRGKVGKPVVTADFNYEQKFPGRYAKKLDSYEGYLFRNSVIEYEVPVRETNWGYYQPLEVANHYKKPQMGSVTYTDPTTGITSEVPDEYIFPNVDWPSAMVKDHAPASRVNLNISGGTDFAKYFGSLTYNHDGDILQTGQENGKPYKSHWDYDRFNYRTNLDFDITKTTTLSANISGFVGMKYDPFGVSSGSSPGSYWTAIYYMPPNAMPVRWPTGEWGGHPTVSQGNNVAAINNLGNEKTVRTQVSTDFVLRQKLDFITQGLSAAVTFNYDTEFTSAGGVMDLGGNSIWKFIDPKIIDINRAINPATGKPFETELDYTFGSLKSLGAEDFDYVVTPVNFLTESSAGWNAGTDYWGLSYNPPPYRRLGYEAKINYARTFGKHDVGAMGVFKRDLYAQSSAFPSYREDWVGRLTYNYAAKYLFETNASYNGSEKFGPGYRFGFFPSLAIGWMASNEEFLKFDWLDKLKFRYSIGKVGNDNFSANRWAYSTIWATDDRTMFGLTNSNSPYLQYKQSVVGNPLLHWEKSTKQNFGLELGVLKNRININVDYFTDHRTDIFMSASQRQIPTYFGQPAVAANLGETKTKGYELEVKLQNSTKGDFRYWMNWAYTHSIDEVIYMEDPTLLFDYQKNKGFQISQTKTSFHDGFVNTWNDVYATTNWSTNNGYKLPGDVNMVDYNGDGTIDSFDSAPWGYPTRPQNTYNLSLGVDWKGFSAMIQFYGVFNVSRLYPWNYWSFADAYYSAVYPDISGDRWTPTNLDATYKAVRFADGNSQAGTLNYVDASYLRLKTAEISYTLDKAFLQKIGLSSLRFYVNGNNLWFWSDMVDDRESSSGDVTYPMMERVTFGASIIF